MMGILLVITIGVAAKVAEGVQASKRREEERLRRLNALAAGRTLKAFEAKGFCIPSHMRYGCGCKDVSDGSVRCPCMHWYEIFPPAAQHLKPMFVECCLGVDPLAIVLVCRPIRRRGQRGSKSRRYIHLATLCPSCCRAEPAGGVGCLPSLNLIRDGSVSAYVFGAEPEVLAAAAPYR